MSNLPETLPAAFFENVQLRPEKLLYSQFLRADSHDKKFSLIKRSYKQVAERVAAIAGFLKHSGLNPGERVAIISATRPEWLEADIAIMSIGGVVVSLYPSLLEAEIAYILYDSEAKFIFVENIEQLEKVLNVSEKLNPIPASEDRPASEQELLIKKIISFETTQNYLESKNFKFQQSDVLSFEEIFNDSPNEGAAAAFNPSWYQSLNVDSIASIVYTSGTTGPQKGVMQTHRNHLANIRQAHSGGLYRLDSVIFMLLPLAHSFARLMGYIGFIAGVELQFPSISDRASSKANQRRVLLDLSQSSSSVIPLVPRILEKMKEGILVQSQRSGVLGSLLKFCLNVALDHSGTSGNKGKYPQGLQNLLFFITSPVRRSIKKKLFGRCFEYVISGGAKLDSEINKFFAAIEIEVLEGYGLTETCVATNCNRPGQNKIGTVGQLLASDIEIRLAEDGEISFRGPNVAIGYLNQPAATKRAWDSEGWFHTGDLGILSPEGFLSITGRKKEIIVTSGGKKISPERIETLLKGCQLLSHAMLVGEARPYCVAIVTPNREKFISVLRQYALSSVEQLFGHPEILKQITQHQDLVNQELASFESVKKLLFVRDDFSIENGFLTPTLKMKRPTIVKHYQKEIESLYQSSEKVLLQEG